MPAAPVSILPNAYAPPTPSAPAGAHGSFVPGDAENPVSVFSRPSTEPELINLFTSPYAAYQELPKGTLLAYSESEGDPAQIFVIGELNATVGFSEGITIWIYYVSMQNGDPWGGTIIIPTEEPDPLPLEPMYILGSLQSPAQASGSFVAVTPSAPESIFGFSIPSPAVPTGRGNFTPASPSAPNRGRSNFSPPSPAAPDAIQENFVPFVGPLYYYRPDGFSRYLRPDGFSYYLRPGSTEGYYPPEIGVDFSPDQPDAPNAATSSFSPPSPSAPVNGHGSFNPPSPSPPADVNHGFSPSNPFAPSQIRGAFSPASPAAPSVIRSSSSIGTPSAPEIIHVSFSPASPDRPAAILPPLDSSTSTYFRPGGVDIYLRPDGESTYLR